jgi:hypothetical protein
MQEGKLYLQMQGYTNQILLQHGQLPAGEPASQ